MLSPSFPAGNVSFSVAESLAVVGVNLVIAQGKGGEFGFHQWTLWSIIKPRRQWIHGLIKHVPTGFLVLRSAGNVPVLLKFSLTYQSCFLLEVPSSDIPGQLLAQDKINKVPSSCHFIVIEEANMTYGHLSPRH